MNHSTNSTHPVSSYWFSETSNICDQVADLAKETIPLEWRSDLRDELLIQIPFLPPCQIIVLEVESFPAESAHAKRLLDQATSRIETALRVGKHPIIICLGDNLPSERVVQWIKKGVVNYAEASSTPAYLLNILQDAYQHANEKLAKYLRYLRLEQLGNELSADERAVLDMIFEGLPNKTIASRLRVSQRTVETRRHRLFEKFESKSLPIVVQRVCEWNELRQQFRNQH